MMPGFPKTLQNGIKGNGGFTLVELIVTLAIAAILMGLAIVVLLSGTTMAANQIEKDNNKNLAGNITDFMKETIQYSSKEVLVSSVNPNLVTNQDYGWIYISDNGTTLANQGFLYFRTKGINNPPQNVFGQDFYSDKKIGISVTIVDNDTFKVTVNVYDSKDALVHQMTDNITLTKKAFDSSMPGISPTSGEFSPAFIVFK